MAHIAMVSMVMAYMIMAYIVTDCMIMADIAMTWTAYRALFLVPYIYGLCSNGLYSYERNLSALVAVNLPFEVVVTKVQHFHALHRRACSFSKSWVRQLADEIANVGSDVVL